MKVYVIASTEYEANMPDLFLMTEDGNYYGVSNHSYAKWHDYPKGIEHWKGSICSDSDRFFNIDLVDIDERSVLDFDLITRAYKNIDRKEPKFGKPYPSWENYKTKKAYKEEIERWHQEYFEWTKTSGLADYVNICHDLWKRRTEMFLSFSSKVADAISDNDNIKYLNQ